MASRILMSKFKNLDRKVFFFLKWGKDITRLCVLEWDLGWLMIYLKNIRSRLISYVPMYISVLFKDIMNFREEVLFDF